MNLTLRLGANGAGRFQILSEDGVLVLGRGLRISAEGGRDCVLTVYPASEQPKPAALDRLKHEYALKDELDRAWAARPLELLQEDGRTILVLEDPGGDLLSRRLGAPMEVGYFLHLAVGLAAALGKVHQRGLVHKDIKPANVLVNGATGGVWLTGFGIASPLPRQHQAPEPPEFIAGTLPYMAPEQTGRMNRSIDSRSDLYSLGVTFYQMLSGALPFTASDPMEWVHCHIARKPPPPSERFAHIPGPVSAIIMKLLAKTPEERYQTAAGVESDLRKCLTAWATCGGVDAFALGAQDVPDRLLIPEKLYGREAEIDVLLSAFARVAAGGSAELVLVSGYAGIGKSSTVNELHKALVPPRGLFAAGKFDQYKRDIPYATLAQAFQSLVRQLLNKSDAELARWRNELKAALGPNGQLMVNLIPELALIIGEQPPAPDIPAQEAQNRFQLTFRRFLGVFASPEHPLALFLDDLQWLDTATLEMLEHLAAHPEVRNVLLIGAYRDNEVGPSHPLLRILDVIRNAGGKVHEIVLAPLQPDDVGNLVAESLHCDQQNAQPLAQLVHEKTDGNPFFAIQFFTALADEALLRFDHRTRAWTWDLPRIRAKGFTDNVADLMAAKLGRLPDTTQSALGQLACLGNVADLATITMAYGLDEDRIHAELREAARAGLVFLVNGAYKFLHDRVQEAAYGLIPEGERAKAHLRIGRALLSRTKPEELEENIFDIVNHLNRGAALIATREERARVVEVNLIAGKRAKRSTAYAASRNYLAQAAALLPPDAWTGGYEQTFDLYLALSECEYLVGNFAEADSLFDLILEKGRSDLDRAKVHSLRIKLYQVAGKYDEGMAVALAALRQFGVTFPESDQEIETAVDAQFREVPSNLKGRQIGELLDAPVAAEPVTRAIIDLLVDATPCAYIARPTLFPLISLEAVNRSMRDGNTDQSSYAYAIYALMLVSVAGDIESAFQFSEMSLRLNERFNNARLRGTLLHLHGDHINFWRRHIATDMPILERAFAACLEVGDFVYAGFLAFETVWQVIERGSALEDVLTLSAKYAAFARQSHNDAVYETIRLEQQFVASLAGRNPDPLSFDNDGFDEAASFAVIVKAAFGCGVVFYHIMKQTLAFLYGRYAEALDSALRAEPVLGAAMAMPIEATYHFYHALTLTALYPTAPPAQQEHFGAVLKAKLKKLKLWADNSPENYGNRYALVSAEVARIDGRDFEAMRLYEDAVLSAREHGFVQNEGLALELAARFYQTRGFELTANAYLRAARRCYLQWGAQGKVRQLDRRYPYLREETPQNDPTTGTILAPVEGLDLATVIKVSQNVSGEIVAEKLIDTLMRTAIEHAGAERGLLILPRGDDYRIEAEARTGERAVTVALRQTSVTADDLPESVFHYVLRTRESVLLHDGLGDNPFSSDDYIRRRRTRSMLCMPLLKQTRLQGVLYLENNLAPRVFTPARMSILELLASQAAISLENTRLYGDLQEREARVRRLVDANIIGIFIWGVEGRIVEANESFLQMVGYDREDLAAGRMEWIELTPVEWRGADRQHLAEVKATGAIQPYEKEFLRKDGSRVQVLIGAAVFDGARDQGVSFVVDLTDRKQAEEAARESERRYREVQMELAHANRVATMGQLTASIAHEVNHPIAATLTNAQTALRWLDGQAPDIDRARRAVERIVNDGRRAADVIGRIRDLVKKAPPRKDELEVNEAIFEVIELTRSEMSKNGVRVHMQLAVGLSLVRVDRVQLQQVIMNLIVNAIEAMSETSEGPRELLISTETEPGAVLVAVRDSGPGLAQANSERAFEAFYTTKPTGLGMGLSICRSIVEAHGGRLWAAPNKPRGAVFYLTLPVE